ncbi:hypothetical protein CLV24_12932 [Pontibacter ummariensis]|uniref:Uncharacterized protein n=1 Tax=Pontibacter ummariensis TaxID=1610492 RepID=A0A239KJB5_9BACT|nr:DUF6687 family protein [Pontibacter ummariensis]PRY05715.1 hypothetical protein CLV24_12932 [Pontibacter ummariensis]SNT18090.1 hypothetical protein SAMN06296052_12926 [Pontibacter ummariensis]
MQKRQFIPFSEVKKKKAIVVDSTHPNGVMLSHWKGAPTPAEIRDDTSAAIVLNALRQGLPSLDLPYVTANHFDIDGFVGVWALLNPALALENEELLRQMALIGDFRELDLNHPLAGEALKLVCWINAKERELFYKPFAADEMEEKEAAQCAQKFRYFLREFNAVLKDPDWEKGAWEDEVASVLLGYRDMYKPDTKIERYPDVGLVIVQTPHPLHYYALFSRTQGFDMVLTCYEQNRYELEYKYTTWVDIATRPTLPRLSMAPLAERLNALETSGRLWTHDAVTETGPLLRLEGSGLSRSEAYDNPTEREIYSSSIPVGQFKAEVLHFYREAYAGISPKQHWTWKEVKELS